MVVFFLSLAVERTHVLAFAKHVDPVTQLTIGLSQPLTHTGVTPVQRDEHCRRRIRRQPYPAPCAILTPDLRRNPQGDKLVFGKYSLSRLALEEPSHTKLGA